VRLRWRKGLRVLLEGAAILGAILVFVSAGIFVVERATATWFWRGGEYDKLSSLRAGFDLRYFEDRLGLPFASRTNRGLVENGFKGHGYWVQTISRHGTVELYAVTSCDKSFHPTFTVAGSDIKVELNRDHLADVAIGSAVAYDYSIGASAPSLLYEAIYGGTYGFYKTSLWGLSSLCGLQPNLDVPNVGRTHSGFASELGQEGQNFRNAAVINTFAETAPAVGRNQPRDFGIEPPAPPGEESVVNLYRFGDFYIGPDRVLLQGENR